jgi:hypothetical protein
MNVNDYIKQLKCYLDSADAVYLLGKQKNSFHNVLDHLERDIQDCEKQETTPPVRLISIDSVLQTLQYLQAVLIEQPITPSATKFIADYALLVFNCNSNIFKNAQLDMLSMTINRFCELRITSLELIQQLRLITNKLQQLNSLSFQPSVLSKHYLSSFDEDKNNK